MQIKTYWDQDAREIDVVLYDATDGSAAFTFSTSAEGLDFADDLADLLDRYNLTGGRSAAQAPRHAILGLGRSTNHRLQTRCQALSEERSR